MTLLRYLFITCVRYLECFTSCHKKWKRGQQRKGFYFHIFILAVACQWWGAVFYARCVKMKRGGPTMLCSALFRDTQGGRSSGPAQSSLRTEKKYLKFQSSQVERNTFSFLRRLHIYYYFLVCNPKQHYGGLIMLLLLLKKWVEEKGRRIATKQFV